MTVQELYDALTERYPRSLSCSWDNDGLMTAGNPSAPVRRVLLALDASEATLAYAVEHGFDTLLTHHPMLFRGVKSVTPDTLSGRKIITCLRGNLAVLSFHTRLDAGEGGVNDALAAQAGFVPSETFGDEEAPTLGRIAVTEEGMTGEELAQQVKERLGCPAIRMTGDGTKTIRRIGFCGGDGKDFIPAALQAGCDAYITGDAGYNMSEDAADDGLLTLELGHYHSEAPVLRPLADWVRDITGAETAFYNSCAYRIL